MVDGDDRNANITSPWWLCSTGAHLFLCHWSPPFFFFFGFGLSLGYGLLFARLARRLNFCPPHTSTRTQCKARTHDIENAKKQQQTNGFSIPHSSKPVGNHRVYCLKLTRSQSWIFSSNLGESRAQRCLSSKNHRVCISISDGFPISMALAKPDAPAKPALRLMAMLTNSRDH